MMRCVSSRCVSNCELQVAQQAYAEVERNRLEITRQLDAHRIRQSQLMQEEEVTVYDQTSAFQIRARSFLHLLAALLQRPASPAAQAL